MSATFMYSNYYFSLTHPAPLPQCHDDDDRRADGHEYFLRRRPSASLLSCEVFMANTLISATTTCVAASMRGREGDSGGGGGPARPVWDLPMHR